MKAAVARKLATALARLSGPHAITEQRAGEDARGTIGYVAKHFEENTEFAGKSANTRRDYKYCAEVARERGALLAHTKGSSLPYLCS